MATLQLAEEHVFRMNERQPPKDEALRIRTWWTNTLNLYESVLENEANEDSWMIDLPSIKEFQWILPISGNPVECGLLRLGIDLPGTNSSSLILTVPRKFLWSVFWASIIIPTISANNTRTPYVDVAVWAFGIMANVPNLYALANSRSSSSIDMHAEDAIWKVARGWSVSFGPVFALIFVMLLRTKLLREKRKAFGILMFVLTTLGILILMLATREGSWGILDLLSICVSWCAVVSYMIVDELRIITASVAGDRDQTGSSQRPQTGRHESAEDTDSQLESGQVSVQNDSVFTLGDDSTLDGRASRVGS